MGSLGYTYRLADERLESSPTESDLRILLMSKLHMCQQCALAAKRTKHTVEGIKHSTASQLREDCPTLLCIGVASP